MQRTPEGDVLPHYSVREDIYDILAIEVAQTVNIDSKSSGWHKHRFGRQEHDL
jgi:hypothetical protein